MMKHYVGLDVSKDRLDVSLLMGDQRLQHQVANTPAGLMDLHQWLLDHSDASLSVGMEATGRYHRLAAEFFHQQGLQTYVINPMQVKAFGKSRLRRNKTDALDADLIAEFVNVNHPELYQPLEVDQQRLQDTYRRRDQLLKTQQQERNRLASGDLDEFVIDSIHAMLDFLDTQLKQVEQQLKVLVKQPALKPDYDLLVSVPGIGWTTAVALLSEVRDWRAFQHVNQIVAYAGLNPRLQQSGKSQATYTPLSKLGNPRLRKALYMPSINAKRWNPRIQDLHERMTANGKHPMEIIGATMKKLLQLALGVLKSGQPFDPDWLQNSQGAA
jgi:transposase